MNGWFGAAAFCMISISGIALAVGSSSADSTGAAANATTPTAPVAASPRSPPFVVRNRQVGMIVSNIAYSLGPDAEESGACPQGLSRSFVDGYRATHSDIAQQSGETERDYRRRIATLSSTAPSGENLCRSPEAASDPHARVITGRDVPTTGGIDLDGQDSRASRRAAPGTCAHDDFRGADGSRGIDNQYYRVVGCTQSYQSRGLANTFEGEMLTGSWAILVELKEVDDLQNDPDVIVGIHASADPIQVSAARVPIPHGTYTADADPRFRATTRGRIVNGVLFTDPVSVRFHWTVNGMHLERPLRAARMRVTLTSAALTPQAEGFLSGYTPVREWYDNNVGFSAGRDAQGNPSPPQRILGTAVGAANVLGYTCHGMYQAMLRAADGDRDPRTGQCSSISTQYRIRAIPAFIVNG